MKQLTEKFLISPIDVGKSQTRKKLKPGSLPVVNMPKKMFQTLSIPRVTPKRITKEIDDRTNQYNKFLEEVKVRIKKLKLSLDWMVNVSEDVVTLSEHVELFTVPKFRIKIDDRLVYTIQIFDWLLPEDHGL